MPSARRMAALSVVAAIERAVSQGEAAAMVRDLQDAKKVLDVLVEAAEAYLEGRRASAD